MRNSAAAGPRDRLRALVAATSDAASEGWRGYALGLLAVAGVSAVIGTIESRTHVANVSMLYLIVVLATATLAGRGPAVFASLASFVAFDWFFVRPIHTLTVASAEEWFALVLFLLTATITGQLAAGQRRRADEAAQREREATLLYGVAHLLGDPDTRAAIRAVAARLRESLGLAAVVIEIDDEAGMWRATSGSEAALPGPLPSLPAWIPATQTDEAATGRAQRWIRTIPPGKRGRSADDHLHTVALRSGERRIGSLALVRASGGTRIADDRLLTAVASQLTSAIERSRLRARATETEVLRRADQLKTALLNAVSHDLRTPLASIIASAGSLRQKDVPWSEAEREGFVADIEAEARRLSRIVTNLLDLSRMESGTLRPERGWYDLAALVDDVLGRLRGLTAGRHVQVRIADDLPPIPLDYVEIDQVLTNLIENAVRHTPPGTDVFIDARLEGDAVVVEVADAGPGIPRVALDDLFESFARVPARRGAAGTGLGLAVARGLVEAHGGRISAGNRPAGGAYFRFTLPLRDDGVGAAAEARAK